VEVGRFENRSILRHDSCLAPVRLGSVPEEEWRKKISGMKLVKKILDLNVCRLRIYNKEINCFIRGRRAMLKRDTHSAAGKAKSTIIQADSADAPPASPNNVIAIPVSPTQVSLNWAENNNAGSGAASNDSTVTTSAPTRHRTQKSGRSRRQRLSIVMQLLARLQQLNSL
jgi:hypothetical protein